MSRCVVYSTVFGQSNILDVDRKCALYIIDRQAMAAGMAGAFRHPPIFAALGIQLEGSVKVNMYIYVYIYIYVPGPISKEDTEGGQPT